ncbi:MAG: hypothetical protein HRO68_06325 [Nitrosopumilus sp.]|nr:hypothetical protein [Nitrosopumilus sp.]
MSVILIIFSLNIFFDHDAIPKKEIIALTNDAINQYNTLGIPVFKKISNRELNDGYLYPFVIHLNGTIVAHGAFSERVGTQSISIVFSQQKYDSSRWESTSNYTF